MTNCREDRLPALLVFWELVAVIVIVGCNNPTSSVSNPVPDEARRLIDELNSWPKGELELYMTPRLPLGPIVGGESISWIEDHIDAINDCGMDVSRNPNVLQFELVKKGGMM